MRPAWWLAMAMGLASCAESGAQVPPDLAFPAGESAALRVKASGVQIYECKAGAQDATKLEWTLVAPEAQLYGTGGGVLGRHYGGPTWEALDGSRVVGALRARADAPAADAIPWLRLSAASTSGSGVFSRIKSIQRIDTVGGKPPPSCASGELGQILRVPYSAVYVFSEAR